MKKTFVSVIASLVLGSWASLSAQGYHDGVDNFNADRMDVAKTILLNTINDPSTDKAVADYYLGQIAYNEGDFAAAQKYFTDGTAANATYGYNFIGLGQMALKNGDKKAAEQYFKDGMNTDKKNAALIAAVARAYYNVDPALYSAEIQKNIDKALKASKNTEASVYILQGDMVAADDPGDAAAKYEMAITMDGDKGQVNREAYVKYASTYFRVNPKFAIAKLEELNEKEPNSALAQRELAEKYYDNDQFGSACIQYGKYMANPNHFQNDEQRYAGLLYSAGEYQKSLDIANGVLAKDPDNEYMYRVIMLDKTALKDFAGAEEAGRKLFADPNAKKIANDYILFADALADQSKFDEAIEIYQQAIAANPAQSDLLPKLSAMYDRAGQGEKAIETMKQYLDAGNGSVQDIFNMARTYDRHARSLPEGTPERTAAAQEGLKYIDMAIEKVPDNAALYRTKGQLLLAANENKPTPEMAQAYEKMLEIFDQDPANKEKQAPSYKAAYYLLGTYYMGVDKAKAKEYFEKYLVIYPEDASVRQIVDQL